MKKIIVLITLCCAGCAGLNQDMLANALNNVDEQLAKDCKCKKEKKKSSKLDPRFSLDLYDDEDWKNEQ